MAGIDTVELGGDLEIALKTTSAGIELQRNPSIFKMGVFKRLFSPLIEEWFNGISSINLPPLTFNYYQMIQATMKKPMTTATIYSKHLIARPTDWQENDHIVGPILDEDQHNFEPSPTLLDFFNKWKSEKIIFVGLGSMMGAMLGNNEQIQFLNNIQAALKNNNCKAVISLVGYQQTDINNLSNTDNIFYLKQIIPHSWLFLNVSAVIHHGGAGTTHASLRYGLPTFILSFVVDQPFNGDRIFINKLGPRHIPMAKTNVKNLTNAIHDLINHGLTTEYVLTCIVNIKSLFHLNKQLIIEEQPNKVGPAYGINAANF
ncbi:unnamed protein product [Rotaria sordida]|uniref:Erythromycin biosynthesis protein CIII-like C-terminal domain-containing protein n=1 Tax=Rotaria sordida TaxID=392033 RepID=A0A819NYG2_9BILA|nr:unnamed protein product [Rotaria sordida]